MVAGIDQSIHVSVDGSIYPRPGIDDRTSPENLEVERRKKQALRYPFEASPEQFWCPELPGGFLGLLNQDIWIDRQVDRSIYPRFGG